MAITRRELLGGMCAAGAAAVFGPRLAWGDQPTSSKSEPFSFVHMTDIHLTTRRQGDKGYRACVDSVNALKPRPDFVLMGGDLAFDGNYTAKDNFAEQIRLYKQISDTLAMPYYNCMGNHDLLGMGSRRKVPVTDPDLGKKMIMDALEWKNSFYSFDHNGWHFVVLDSMYPVNGKDGPTYEPRIGKEQLDWLAADLGAAGDRPKVAVTHIAAFCNMGQMSGDPNRKAMDGHMVVWDTKELRTILERHKVKALLQGHSHKIEEYRLNGVWYLTSTAASGSWWTGSWAGSPQGYTVFTCDGDRLTWEHKTYEWEPKLDPGDDLERRKIAEQQAEQAEQKRLLERDRAGR